MSFEDSTIPENTTRRNRPEQRRNVLQFVVGSAIGLLFLGCLALSVFATPAPPPDEQTTEPAITSKLEDVVAARGVASDLAPLDPADSFAATDTIYLTYRIVDAAVGDELSVVYFIDNVEQAPAPEDRDRFDEAGTFRGFFVLQGQADQPRPAGAYRAELRYNGEAAATVEFTVE